MDQAANTSNPFTQIGIIIRSQGLKGECKVSFETGDTHLVEELQMVYLRNDRGDFYPCRISNIRVEGKGNKQSFFVQFDHIADRNSAESLKNRAVFIETDKAAAFFDEPEDQDSLIDFEVFDNSDESLGLVIDEMDNGAHLIIVVATSSGSLMIPVVEEYVLNIDNENRSIYCQNLNLLEDLL